MLKGSSRRKSSDEGARPDVLLQNICRSTRYGELVGMEMAKAESTQTRIQRAQSRDTGVPLRKNWGIYLQITRYSKAHSHCGSSLGPH